MSAETATIAQGARERFRGLHIHERALLLAAPAVCVFAFFYQPYCHHGPVICAYRLMTGLPCPGCGLTRAFCEITHGHLWTALAMHPLSLAIFAYAVYYVAGRWAFVLAGIRVPVSLSRWYKPMAIVLIGAHLARMAWTAAVAPGEISAGLSAGFLPRLISYFF